MASCHFTAHPAEKLACKEYNKLIRRLRGPQKVKKVQRHTAVFNKHGTLNWVAIGLVAPFPQLTTDASPATTDNDQPSTAAAPSHEPSTKQANQDNRKKRLVEEYAVSRIVRPIATPWRMPYIVRWYKYRPQVNTTEPAAHIPQRFI